MAIPLAITPQVIIHTEFNSLSRNFAILCRFGPPRKTKYIYYQTRLQAVRAEALLMNVALKLDWGPE